MEDDSEDSGLAIKDPIYMHIQDYCRNFKIELQICGNYS
jgi:hypothetical protein